MHGVDGGVFWVLFVLFGLFYFVFYFVVCGGFFVILFFLRIALYLM